jgi:hypothetical protein
MAIPVKVTGPDGSIKEYIHVQAVRASMKIGYTSVKNCLADKNLSWNGYKFEYLPKGYVVNNPEKYVSRVKNSYLPSELPKTPEEKQLIFDTIFSKDGVRKYMKAKRSLA